MRGVTQETHLLSFYLTAMRDLGRALTLDARNAGAARPMRESLLRMMGTFAVGRGALLLWNAKKKCFASAAARGLRLPTDGLDFAPRGRQLKALTKGVRPFHPHMPPGGLEGLRAALAGVLEKFDIQWIVPLTTGRSFVGLALLGPRLNGDPLKTIDLEVLEEMALVIALRIEDSRTRADLAAQVRQLQRQQRAMKQIYMETVQALAGVIDGPESGGGPGHSVRVAALAAEMGRKLKLKANACERLYIAGLLHDIGKQIISREVLEKKGALAAPERRALEAHPVAGCELISHLQFPWGDVAEIIRHHHERLDGTGYPDQLAGDQISIEAKILMMAEAFDSMTSDQPWRPRLGLEKICEQIGENLGLQFEPSVVRALIDTVEAGLNGRAANADFVPHLTGTFDAALIKNMLSELRRQLTHPRKAALVIEAIRSA